MIDRILVALDGSSRSTGVLAAAVAIAQRFDAELLPLRVIFIPAEFPPSAHVRDGDPLRAHMVHDAEEGLSALTASVTGARVSVPVVLDG